MEVFRKTERFNEQKKKEKKNIYIYLSSNEKAKNNFCFSISQYL